MKWLISAQGILGCTQLSMSLLTNPPTLLVFRSILEHGWSFRTMYAGNYRLRPLVVFDDNKWLLLSFYTTLFNTSRHVSCVADQPNLSRVHEAPFEQWWRMMETVLILVFYMKPVWYTVYLAVHIIGLFLVFPLLQLLSILKDEWHWAPTAVETRSKLSWADMPFCGRPRKPRRLKLGSYHTFFNSFMLLNIC